MKRSSLGLNGFTFHATLSLSLAHIQGSIDGTSITKRPLPPPYSNLKRLYCKWNNSSWSSLTRLSRSFTQRERERERPLCFACQPSTNCVSFIEFHEARISIINLADTRIFVSNARAVVII